MSVAIYNMPKIGIIQQITFVVSCLFCKTIAFFCFCQEKYVCLMKKDKEMQREEFIFEVA